MTHVLYRLDLPALDGANPLGFLAALGTLSVLSTADGELRLGWQAGPRWTPFLVGPSPMNQAQVCQTLMRELRGRPVRPGDEAKRQRAQRRFDAAKKRLRDAQQALRKLKLKGERRTEEWDRTVAPLERRQDRCRQVLLGRLRQAVPSAELALGQRPDCTTDEFRDHAHELIRDHSVEARSSLALLSAFGAEPARGSGDRILPTPFCFITGSGHQWFLDTARELMACATSERMAAAIFKPWSFSDDKFSMRWDPREDRRYALMDRDPTSGDNKPRTVWMANLLGYRALAFFPCASGRGDPASPGWTWEGDAPSFTWPLWEVPLPVDTVRSLLRHPAFASSDLRPWRAELRLRGVAAVYRSHRIEVGSGSNRKLNFTPAQAV